MSMSQPQFTLGYTDMSTIKLDMDGTTFKKVKEIADYIVVHYHLKGYIILKSSKNSYHVVFDKIVTWEENVKTMAWISWRFKKRSYMLWFTMQIIKGASTLRISKKGKKKPPRIVRRFGRQDRAIKEYLDYRERFKNG